MIRFGADSFEELAEEVAFCLENLRHPACQVQFAGPFYENAAEALRAHGILRLLIDADAPKFSNDLIMSGQARRAWLRRCKSGGFANYYTAFSRSGSLFDAIAGEDLALAAEIFSLSPPDWMQGDEYEEDFCYQRFLGLHVAGAPVGERAAVLARFETAAEDGGARLEICQALHAGQSDAFEAAFQNLLRTHKRELAEDKERAAEELAVAVGTKVFIEGIAVLKLARRDNLTVALQYPMCPSLALLPQPPARPPDEFAVP